MPPADTLVVEWFHKIGRCVSNGMGINSVSWAEIESFNNIQQLNLSPWESAQIRLMSENYTSMLSIAKKPLTPCPWHGKKFNAREFARAKVAAQMDEFFG